jgi:hypothetical protein
VIALVRSRMTAHPVMAGMWRPIAEQGLVEDAGSFTVQLTVWTRDGVVGAVLSHAPLFEAAISAANEGTSESPDIEQHLLAVSGAPESSWLSIAGVIIREERLIDERQLSDIFERFPGCLIAGVLGPGDICVVGSRDGWSARIVGRPAHCKATRVVGWYASLAYIWRTSGRHLSALADAYVTVAVEPAALRERASCGRIISVIGPHL